MVRETTPAMADNPDNHRYDYSVHEFMFNEIFLHPGAKTKQFFKTCYLDLLSFKAIPKRIIRTAPERCWRLGGKEWKGRKKKYFWF